MNSSPASKQVVHITDFSQYVDLYQIEGFPDFVIPASFLPLTFSPMSALIFRASCRS